MYNFSFCVPSSERANPAKNGTPRGSVFPMDLLSRSFFNKLWWETTLFEFNSPKDIPHNSKQNNGSLVEEVWKHESMGGIYELGHTKSHMCWESPTSTHPPWMPHLLIALYHLQKTREATYSLHPRPSEVSCRCRNISQNKTFITIWVFSSAHPGQGLGPSLPSLIHAWDCNRGTP